MGKEWLVDNIYLDFRTNLVCNISLVDFKIWTLSTNPVWYIPLVDFKIWTSRTNPVCNIFFIFVEGVTGKHRTNTNTKYTRSGKKNRTEPNQVKPNQSNRNRFKLNQNLFQIIWLMIFPTRMVRFGSVKPNQKLMYFCNYLN